MSNCVWPQASAPFIIFLVNLSRVTLSPYFLPWLIPKLTILLLLFLPCFFIPWVDLSVLSVGWLKPLLFDVLESSVGVLKLPQKLTESCVFSGSPAEFVSTDYWHILLLLAPCPLPDLAFTYIFIFI